MLTHHIVLFRRNAGMPVSNAMILAIARKQLKKDSHFSLVRLKLTGDWLINGYKRRANLVNRKITTARNTATRVSAVLAILASTLSIQGIERAIMGEGLWSEMEFSRFLRICLFADEFQLLYETRQQAQP